MLSSAPIAPASSPPHARFERIELAAGEIRHITTDDIALLVLAGAVRIEDGRSAWVAPAGHAMTVPSGHTLRIAASRGCILGIMPIDSPFDATPRLIRISPLSMALARHDDDNASYHAPMRALLLQEIRRAERVPHGVRLPRNYRARLIAQAIVRDPADPRSLVDLAAQSGLSRRTVLRLFVAETGMSFRHFRRAAKIHHSLVMLAEGVAIQEAALAVGYEGTPAFIAAFRAVIGCTPGRYMRRVAAINAG
jgi:AraC-like DNA-binding protein